MNTLPVGARAKVDGCSVVVKAAFPKGSTSYLFPHYKVDFVGGDKNVAVKWERVST